MFLQALTGILWMHEGAFLPALPISLILVMWKGDMKKTIMRLEGEVCKKGFILSIHVSLQNEIHQRCRMGLCLRVVHWGAHLLFIYFNDGSPPSREAQSPNENPRHPECFQHSALSLARPGAGWHAYASLRTHALSCVIPHLVTICHCHPWHVTLRQTDLTPVPSLTLGWEATVIGIEIAGREWLISLWHNSNTM